MATRYSWFFTSRGMPTFTLINVLCQGLATAAAGRIMPGGHRLMPLIDGAAAVILVFFLESRSLQHVTTSGCFRTICRGPYAAPRGARVGVGLSLDDLVTGSSVDGLDGRGVTELAGSLDGPPCTQAADRLDRRGPAVVAVAGELELAAHEPGDRSR